MLVVIGAVLGGVMGAAGTIIAALIGAGKLFAGPRPAASAKIWKLLLGVCATLLVGCIIAILVITLWPSHDGGDGPPTPLAIAIVDITTPVAAGSAAKLVAETSPGAICTIEVTWPSGSISDAKALKGAKTADDDGRVQWDWPVSGHTEGGSGGVRVTASLNGETAQDEAVLVVK